MADAYRDDSRRVVGIAAPLFTMGFMVEALSHIGRLDDRLFLQPVLSALLCGVVWGFGRRLLPTFRYPEFLLLILLWLVAWGIALHMTSIPAPASANTLVMLAVAAVGSSTLIMPPVAAVLAMGSTVTLYVYAQIVADNASNSSSLVVAIPILMVVTIIHRSRRSAIRSVEELRERVAWDQRQLELANEQLRNLSVTDSLTGAMNRRGFDDRLAAEIATALRRGETLSVLLFDVDNFKGFNDEFGHPAGDAALIQTVAALKACCRAGDSVARYGGEEFALILPATDGSGCQQMAERARRAVAKLQQIEKPITASVGGATAQAEVLAYQDSVGTALLACADSALYRAKEAGRDRAEFGELSTLDVNQRH